MPRLSLDLGLVFIAPFTVVFSLMLKLLDLLLCKSTLKLFLL